MGSRSGRLGSGLERDAVMQTEHRGGLRVQLFPARRMKPRLLAAPSNSDAASNVRLNFFSITAGRSSFVGQRPCSMTQTPSPNVSRVASSNAVRASKTVVSLPHEAHSISYRSSIAYRSSAVAAARSLRGGWSIRVHPGRWRWWRARKLGPGREVRLPER